jgi:malonyl-CoA O-methyltransferase
MAAAGAAPWLHEEAARRMGERLALVRVRPARVAVWWARSGGGAEVLRRSYRAATFDAVEPQVALADGAPTRWGLRRWSRPRARMEDDLGDASVGLVWANMMLHTVSDPLAVMRRWQRALATDGFLMFSTLGPGSLPQLRALYAAEGWGPPMAPLVDMHDLGDMLVEAGFADPVVDQEQVNLSWRNAEAALDELRSLGGNADPQRWPGLRTPSWRSRLLQGLARQAQSGAGRVDLSFELVYGHAFKAAPRARVTPETSVGVDELRTMARARRRTQGFHEGLPGPGPAGGVH